MSQQRQRLLAIVARIAQPGDDPSPPKLPQPKTMRSRVS
jgi:hypothetical protein